MEIDDVSKTIQSQIEFYHQIAPDFDKLVDSKNIKHSQQYHCVFNEDIHYRNSLDIGCGTGNWTQGLLGISDQVLAVDSSDTMLLLAKQKLGTNGINYQKNNIFDFPNLGKFDCVLSTFWISHVPPSLFSEFWEWIVTLLNPSGRIIILDSIRSGPGGGGAKRILPNGNEYVIIKNNYSAEEIIKGMKESHIDGKIERVWDDYYHIKGSIDINE